MTIETPIQNASQKAEKFSPSSHLNFWLTPEKSAAATILSLPDNCIDELIAFAKGQPLVENNFKETTLFAEKTSSFLNNEGPGMAIIERFPVNELSESQNKEICRVFAQLIGKLIPQDRHDTLLYDVKNKHVSDPLKVRKSITNLAQPFHTDGGWLTTPARIIGLFCISNAVQGGGSEMTSLYSAFQELRRTEPDAAALLCKPLPWNKQGEHTENELAWEMNPLFENAEDRFLGRYYESYVLTGFDISGQKKESAVVEALQLLKSIIQQQPRFSMTLKAGDFQLVNNWTTVHARKEFKDSSDVANIDSGAHLSDQSRHLIRVWCH
ncbi:MAG: TauD/TfdA family dioxygenase [Granulosicoccus sp.]